MRRLPLILCLIATLLVAGTHNALAATTGTINATDAKLLILYLDLVGTIFFLGFAALACAW